ncbi:hypothetical protein M3F30_10360, partial [Corynebacterium sanguinis]|uniref:hypothetical protein n=1 Tax=Corynebacterium sanguinis TaxID=2594913 RepID=UPI00223BF92E
THQPHTNTRRASTHGTGTTFNSKKQHNPHHKEEAVICDSFNKQTAHHDTQHAHHEMTPPSKVHDTTTSTHPPTPKKHGQNTPQCTPKQTTNKNKKSTLAHYRVLTQHTHGHTTTAEK